ncbi:MAG TPA: recombination mediator RecR [Candidatus Polarisedimenticolaceae bacterium]|nr:recombination mediator RecR [Candidatus Polarisedimenticolaceae bacterium]
MSSLPEPLERLIHELTKLPSVGRKTAQRLAFHLLGAPRQDAQALADAIVALRDQIRSCSECFNLSDGERCTVCSDARRDRSRLCVVEQPANLAAIERTAAFGGLYHVLGGALSPLRDLGPDDLHVEELLRRLRAGGFEEVILATNPNVEGEATAVYLARRIEPLGLRVTRLARGLPAGGDLEFTDELTLRRSFEDRRAY